MEQCNVEFSKTPQGINGEQVSNLPSKINSWTKVKNFLFREIKIVELTPYQEKVFKEVHDFWHQDVSFKKFKDFLLQEIEITL